MLNKNCVDLFLEEQNKPNHVGHFSDDQLAMNCLDIFVAGSETTSKSQEVRFRLILKIEITFFSPVKDIQNVITHLIIYVESKFK